MSIKLIDKDTNIEELVMDKVPWDVVVNDVPYQVVRIDGYVHTIGGYHGENNLWMYPRNEVPCYDNLIEYNGYGMGVCWGINYRPHNYIQNKWNEPECYTSSGAMITRNGKDFYFCAAGIHEAIVLINRLQEHPVNPNLIGWDNRLIGRKVFWRSEPAIVTRYIEGQACVILEPDGIDHFSVPAEFVPTPEKNDNYGSTEFVKTEFFDPFIWWFRD